MGNLEFWRNSWTLQKTKTSGIISHYWLKVFNWQRVFVYLLLSTCGYNSRESRYNGIFVLVKTWTASVDKLNIGLYRLKLIRCTKRCVKRIATGLRWIGFKQHLVNFLDSLGSVDKMQ